MTSSWRHCSEPEKQLLSFLALAGPLIPRERWLEVTPELGFGFSPTTLKLCIDGWDEKHLLDDQGLLPLLRLELTLDLSPEEQRFFLERLRQMCPQNAFRSLSMPAMEQELRLLTLAGDFEAFLLVDPDEDPWLWLTDDDEQWQVQEIRLSEFLVNQLFQELMFGARFACEERLLDLKPEIYLWNNEVDQISYFLNGTTLMVKEASHWRYYSRQEQLGKGWLPFAEN